MKILDGTTDLNSVNKNGQWNFEYIEATSVKNIISTEKNQIWFLPEGINVIYFLQHKVEFTLSGFLQYLLNEISKYDYTIQDIKCKEITKDGILKLEIVVLSSQGSSTINPRLGNAY